MEDFHDIRGQLIESSVLALDHSYKLLKRMHCHNGVRPYGSVLAVMDENNRIRSLDVLMTSGNDELRQVMNGIEASGRKLGHKPPIAAYTDVCCAQRKVLSDSFPSLRMEKQNFGKKRNNVIKILESKIVVVYRRHQLKEELMKLMRYQQSKPDKQKMYVALDIEWCVNVSMQKVGKVPLTQLCWKSEKTYEIILIHLESLSGVPEVLANVLNHEKIIFVGKQIGGDVSHLNRDFENVNMQRESYLELGKLCKRRGLVENGGFSLKKLCKVVLHEDLPKDDSTPRLSNWKQKLTEEQRQYAAMDVYAAYKILERCTGCTDLYSRLSEYPTVDFEQKIDLVSGSGAGTVIVAVGTVLDDPQNTRTKLVVKVLQVLKPAYFVNYVDNFDRQKTCIGDYGNEPFTIFWKKSNLRYSSTVEPLVHQGNADNEDFNENDNDDNYELEYQRVLKDGFHLEDFVMRHIPEDNPFNGKFRVAFRECTYTWNKEIMRKVKQVTDEFLPGATVTNNADYF